MRFARALASSGAVVVVPEVPEWRRLSVSPGVVAPTMRGCVELLARRPEVQPGKFGVIGFSFGAPSVALAASREEIADFEAESAGLDLERIGELAFRDGDLESQFFINHDEFLSFDMWPMGPRMMRSGWPRWCDPKWATG